MSLLSVVIVNYHSGELLQACLESLLRNGPAVDAQIFVINNGSAGEFAHLKTAGFSDLRVIQNPSNLGFGRAANIGYCSSQSEYVLLLNPDIRLETNSLESLIETLNSDPETGIVLPQLRHPDGTLQYSCRSFYSGCTLMMRRGPWKKWFSNHRLVREHLMLDWDHQSLRTVDWGLGAAMLIRRSAAGPLLFDERFFLYFEDVDLCLRICDTGWKVLYNPNAKMVHHHQRESANSFSLKAKGRHFFSMVKFLWKYRSKLKDMR
jgi:N-acetylglucosaminyl-diphospho-decaprenol L-rhamnosyltransferase